MAEKKMCQGEDCIFCNSKCPECGSINVNVKVNFVYEYSNGQMNKLYLSQDFEKILLTCEECGERFGDEDFFEYLEFDDPWSNNENPMSLSF